MLPRPPAIMPVDNALTLVKISKYVYFKHLGQILTNFFSAKNFGSEAPEVLHKGQKLFCHVAVISNLVQEFNGLVSTEGPAQAGPLDFR